MGLHDKSWDLRARIDQQAEVSIEYGGQTETHVSKVSPVEHMLCAVASCFAISCKVNMDARKIPSESINVDVHGEKAPDRPSRISDITISVAFTPALDAETADKVIVDAKRLCTVTNSLSSDMNISVKHVQSA